MSFSWKSFLGALCAVVLFAVPASAQLCGDADGNGQVSVTDGVQALRAAATLTNTCTAARCDVDGNGSIKPSTVGRVSATNRRSVAVRRSRRARCVGNPIAVSRR